MNPFSWGFFDLYATIKPQSRNAQQCRAGFGHVGREHFPHREFSEKTEDARTWHHSYAQSGDTTTLHGYSIGGG